MSFLRAHQRTLFGLLLLLLAAVCAWRASGLTMLYTDTEIRGRVQSAMTSVSEREGWLLSDMEVDRVTGTTVFITHRSHVSGPVAISCVAIFLNDSSIHPCDAK